MDRRESGQGRKAAALTVDFSAEGQARHLILIKKPLNNERLFYCNDFEVHPNSSTLLSRTRAVRLVIK